MVQYSNGGLKTGLKKACLWSKMSGSNGLQSHVTLPFEYRTPVLSGILVCGIQMVTVVTLCTLLNQFVVDEGHVKVLGHSSWFVGHDCFKKFHFMLWTPLESRLLKFI